MAKKNISFFIEEEDLAKIDEFARNLERDRSYVLNEAVKMYILDAEIEAREAAEAEAAIARGEGISHEDVFRRVRSLIEEKRAS